MESLKSKLKNYTLEHIIVDGNVFIYKLVKTKNKGTTIGINKDNEIEVRLGRNKHGVEDFIRKHIVQYSRKKEIKNKNKIIDLKDNFLNIQNKKYNFELITSKKMRYEKINNKFYLFVKNLSDREELIKMIYSDLAVKLLTPTIKSFAKLMGVKYESVQYKWVTSKWGHCTSDNKIMINTKLVAFEKKISNSVIIHELAHTIEHNHSRKFWDIVEKFSPDYKECDKTLSSYSVDL